MFTPTNSCMKSSYTHGLRQIFALIGLYPLFINTGCRIFLANPNDSNTQTGTDGHRKRSEFIAVRMKEQRIKRWDGSFQTDSLALSGIGECVLSVHTLEYAEH